jgi:adenylosuccinate synthase
VVQCSSIGEHLDTETNGKWILDGIKGTLKVEASKVSAIIDSVRTKGQISSIRRAYGSRRVVHIHLTAEPAELEWRYKRRPRTGFSEFKTYNEVLKDRTESKIEELAQLADVVIRTDRCVVNDVVVRAASHLSLYGKRYDRLVDVIIGGQFGSEGKGNIVQYLAPEYDYLVRVGGPNAGHTVYEEPEPHVFHLLPSGTRSSEANLILGPGAVLNVDTVLKEIAQCQVDNNRLFIDPQAMIIERSDIRKEKKLVKEIGSTGQGVGYATSRRILRKANSVRLARDITALRPFIRSSLEVLEDAFSAGQRILLEGTQGTGLSLYHGNYPYVTSRDTTVSGCLAEAGISPSRVRKIIMACRSYPIRVGNPKDHGNTSGPMSQEITFSELSRRTGIPLRTFKEKELTSTTRRPRRVAEFDWLLLRRAASLNAPTDVALTFADYVDTQNEGARRFEQLTRETIQFIEEIERVASAPVSLISTRFDFRNIIDRRNW